MLHVISQDRMTKYTITGYTFFRDGGRHKAIAGFGIDGKMVKLGSHAKNWGGLNEFY